jgi:hypothetical protein
MTMRKHRRPPPPDRRLDPATALIRAQATEAEARLELAQVEVDEALRRLCEAGLLLQWWVSHPTELAKLGGNHGLA